MYSFIQPIQTTYLIVVQPAIVSLDIKLSLLDHTPGARLIIAQTALEALDALSSLQSLAVAFLSMGPESVGVPSLSMRIRALGGRTVLIGDAAEVAGPDQDWSVLVKPFTTVGLIATLNRRVDDYPCVAA